MTARPTWVSTHLPAHAATWLRDNGEALADAARHFADLDDTTTEET